MSNSSEVDARSERALSQARRRIVALVGNPNAGKTSLFNALTGTFQKVGNYPGVTVERVSGVQDLAPDLTVEWVDIPGLYSMKAISADEVVARSSIVGELGEAPDLLLCVLDASNLERNLFLWSQLRETGIPLVAAVTMTDTLRSEGESLDVEALASRLGVPSVAVVAHKGEGVAELVEIVEQALRTEAAARPHETEGMGVEDRYRWAHAVWSDVVRKLPGPHRATATERIDRVLTHRVVGLAVFVAVMYTMFQSIYTLARPLMAGIEWCFGQVADWSSRTLAGTPMLESLIVDGLIGGVGTVFAFLPQILILFFFIATLEGTGYLARAAFLMDRLLGWCGLNGRAFIPLLSSFACAIPGIMAARVMPDARSRLATIMVAPLMSCSARLPVYVLVIGAFVEPKYGAGWAGFALFAMHFVGLVVAIPVVLVMNRRFLRGKRLPFLLELPRYQWPKWRDVWFTMYLRAKVFLQTAGTVIVVMSVVIWALLYFPRTDADHQRYVAEYAQSAPSIQAGLSEENFVQQRLTENSYLGRFGKAIEPAFVPAGFDWRIATAILAAFPAREVIVSSLGILFSLGGDQSERSMALHSALHGATWPDGRPLFTIWTAFGLMVFFALCCQCGATLATVRRETNSWKWPVVMFVYMSALAYLAAVGIHQVGRLFGSP